MRQDVRAYLHNLNGVLGAILATSDLHAHRSRDGQQEREAFESISGQVRRAADTVTALAKAITADEAGLDSATLRDLDYLDRIHPPADPVLAQVEQLGQKENIPIVDRDSGRLLEILVWVLAPSKILELGTAYGCSTLWMARGLPEGGRIVTIDPDRGRTSIARGFFEQAGQAARIEIVNRPALEVLPTLAAGSFDMVFIDALKEEYAQYLEACVPLLRSRGLVAVDNLLWAHRASLPPNESDEVTTKAIRRFNEELLRHPQLRATVVPIGDGLGIAAKID